MGNNYEYSKGYCEGYIDGHLKAQGQRNPVNYSDSSYYYNNMQKIELEDETDSSLGAKIRKIAESFAQEPTEVDSVSDKRFKDMMGEILKVNERIRLLEDIVKATPRSNMVEALQEVVEDVQEEIRLKERYINDTDHNTLEKNESKDLPENIQKTFGPLSLTKAVLKLFHYKKKWKSSEISSVLKNVHFKNTKVTSENFNNNLSASLAVLKRQGKIISINGVYNLALKEKVEDNND